MASSLSLGSLLAATIFFIPFGECIINVLPVGFALSRPKSPVLAGTGGGRVTVTPSERTSPPPQPPADWLPGHRVDSPVLVGAGADRLHFKIYISMKNGSCPSHVQWFDKKWEIYESNVQSRNYICVSDLKLQDLSPNKEYGIMAKPVIKPKYRKKNFFTSDWNKGATATSPLITARTCLNEAPPLRNVLVHTVSESWFALSWLPPVDCCLTQYTYFVRYRNKKDKISVGNSFYPVGAFWNDHIWHSVRPIEGGKVVPCSPWPDRHCLVVRSADFRLGEEYVVEVYANRTIDNKVNPIEKKEFTVADLAPEPPEELFCAQAWPTALELRWSCPLRPGGILQKFHVLVRTTLTDARHWYEELKDPTLRPMYKHTITGLRPSTCYNVSVRFVTTAEIAGESASILVWTTPGKNRPTMRETTPATEATMTVENSTCAFGVDTVSQELSDRNRHKEMPWEWIAACAVLVVLIFVAFLLGRRCGMREKWKPTHLKNSQNGDHIIRNPPVSGRSKVKTISYEVSESVGVWRRAGGGDQTALCAAGAPPSRTAPAHASQGYAEVDLASGRAWMVAQRSATPHYEEPPHSSDCYAEIKKNSLYVAEKPYATIGDPECATSPAYYSSVQLSAPPPPPPAAKPSHEYAQVQKKGGAFAGSRSAAPHTPAANAHPAPALPARFPLTDCDQ